VEAETGKDCSKLADALGLSNALLMLRSISNKPTTITASKLSVKHRWQLA